MQNPFVYGEVVPASAFVDREVELERLTERPAGGPEGLPDLAAPLWQVVARAAGAGARRRSGGAMTVSVTVSSYSSYVAFLEGYARALLTADAQAGSRAGLAARAARRRSGPSCASSRDRAAVACPFPPSRTEERRLPAGRSGVRAAGAARDAAQAPAGHRARRVPGDQRVRRGIARGRARAARGHSASARGRLCLLRIRADADGAHARAAAGRSTRPDRSCASSGFPPTSSPLPRVALPERPGLRPEPGLGEAIVELAGNLPYDVQRLAHETWDDVRADGRGGSGSTSCTRRCVACSTSTTPCSRAMWQRLTVPQRGALRAAVLEEGRELLSAGRARASSPDGPSSVQASLAALVRDDVLAREGAPLPRRRLAAAGVGGEKDVLIECGC